ncbi:MAG: hypothetical protein HFI28_08055 [Lachnospiraceae bacterium]|nr:hypothetical protein [Lachnospiraceae bacterium]
MKRKKWMAFGLAIFWMLILSSGKEVSASEQESETEAEVGELEPPKEEFLFEDGDVVGFIGDSITHVEYSGISYQEFLYNYYITRYPQWELEFRNLGVGSYTAADALKLYRGEWGIYDAELEGITKAVIMFGMNEALTGTATEEYIENIQELTELLKEHGLKSEDIILAAPTPFDQTRSSNYLEDGQMYLRVDDSIREYIVKLENLADTLGTHYIDLHTPMLWVTSLLQKEDQDATLTMDDNIHPNGVGNALAGYFFLYQQGADNDVASVRILKNGDALAENAQVRGLKRKGDSYMEFSYQPQSLPLAVPLEVKEANEYIGMLEGISRETLQIEGLRPELRYTVYMNRVKIDVFTGAQLAQGVNLASYDWNPGQMAAKDIEVLNQKWHRSSAEYRSVLHRAAREESTASQEDVDAAYKEWYKTTKEQRSQMYETARSSVERACTVEIVSENCHMWMGQELWKWAVEGAALLVAVLAVGFHYKKQKKFN